MQTRAIVSGALRDSRAKLAICLITNVFAQIIATVAIAEVVRRFINVISRRDDSFILLIAVLLALTLLLAVCKFITNKLKYALSIDLYKVLEDKLIAATLAATQVSDANVRISQIGRNASDIVNRTLGFIFGISGSAATLIAMTVYLAAIDYILVLIPYAVGVISLVIFGCKIDDIAPHSRKSGESMNALFGLSWEHLNNAEVSSFYANAKIFARMKKGIASAKADLVRFNKSKSYVRILERAAYYANIVVYLAVATLRFSSRGIFNLAETSVGVILLPQLTELFYSIPGYINEHKSILGLTKITDEILCEQPGDASAASLPISSLAIRDLGFTYKNMATQQEASISLRSFACNGGVIFVVGETGSGKSTLLKLIAQELPGYKGSMTWDGREISDFEHGELNGQVLFMDSAITFSDTIEENIRLGADMDSERMNEALRSADFDSYVENKPDNIAHIIKEADLSSGENQRLSIARIFYHNHHHFMLDEVLSAIDAGSQLKIMSELRSLAAQRQSVLMLATHNLTLVRGDDSVIFVASDGSCTFGEHRSLLAGSKSYSAFYEREMP